MYDGMWIYRVGFGKFNVDVVCHLDGVTGGLVQNILDSCPGGHDRVVVTMILDKENGLPFLVVSCDEALSVG